MVDNGEHRRVIKGHGTKGKHHDAKTKALQNPTMLIILDGKTYLSHGHTHYVPNMGGCGTLTKMAIVLT
jgi:hypothetical protein